MGSTQTDLSPEQEAAVQVFVQGLLGMQAGMQALEDVGLDAVTAMKSIPNPDDPGRSMYDDMPLQVRLLLG